MTDNSLHFNPPTWIKKRCEIYDVSDLPNAFTDERELWEMVANGTPGSCISAHYSSITLRVVADWLERRMQQADSNGWDYEPWQLVSDLRLAANAADAAIEAGDYIPR